MNLAILLRTCFGKFDQDLLKCSNGIHIGVGGRDKWKEKNGRSAS
jgi:hypothetical protein